MPEFNTQTHTTKCRLISIGELVDWEISISSEIDEGVNKVCHHT